MDYMKNPRQTEFELHQKYNVKLSLRLNSMFSESSQNETRDNSLLPSPHKVKLLISLVSIFSRI